MFWFFLFSFFFFLLRLSVCYLSFFFFFSLSSFRDRAKRRLKSITPLWINSLGLCLLDLNKYGHQPLTFWRVRVQLHLEATKESLIGSYGDGASTFAFVQAIGNVRCFGGGGGGRFVL